MRSPILRHLLSSLLVVAALAATGCMSSSRPARKNLDKDPAHQYRWAQEQFRRGNYLEALEAIDKAIAAARDDYSNYYLRAHIYLAAKEPEKAIDDLERVLEMNPYFTDAHNTMGVAFAVLGRVDRARREFETVLADPKYLYKQKVYYNLGDLYFEQERYADAVEEYRRALTVEPEYAVAHFKLGKALQALGRDEEARQAFDEVLRLAPNSEMAREVKLLLQASRLSS